VEAGHSASIGTLRGVRRGGSCGSPTMWITRPVSDHAPAREKTGDIAQIRRLARFSHFFADEVAGQASVQV
jgi:hypothetical protein